MDVRTPVHGRTPVIVRAESGRRRTLAVATAAVAASVALAAGAFAASTDFFQPASSPVTVGAGPQGVVAADFDGDGDSDLATANVSGGNVTVLRNGGAANFVAYNSSPEPAGSFPDAIATADLNGDAIPDLAVANQVSDDVTILLNKGNGDFRVPTSSPEPAGDVPADVTIADIDGDLDGDLLVANAIEGTGTVTVLRNNGTGNFTQLATSPETVGNKAVSVAGGPTSTVTATATWRWQTSRASTSPSWPTTGRATSPRSPPVRRTPAPSRRASSCRTSTETATAT